MLKLPRSRSSCSSTHGPWQGSTHHSITPRAGPHSSHYPTMITAGAASLAKAGCGRLLQYRQPTALPALTRNPAQQQGWTACLGQDEAEHVIGLPAFPLNVVPCKQPTAGPR